MFHILAMTVAMAAQNKGKSNSSTSRHTSLMSTKSTPTLLICKSEKQARRGREDYYCIWVSVRVSVFVSLCVSRVQTHAQNFQRMGGGVGREPYAHFWGTRVLEPTNVWHQLLHFATTLWHHSKIDEETILLQFLYSYQIIATVTIKDLAIMMLYLLSFGYSWASKFQKPL